MRKIICLLMCFVFIFGLCACNNAKKDTVEAGVSIIENGDETPNETISTNDKKYKELTFRNVIYSVPLDLYSSIDTDNTFENTNNQVYSLYNEEQTIYVMCLNFGLNRLNELDTEEKFANDLKSLGLETDFTFKTFKIDKTNEYYCIETQIEFSGIREDGSTKECEGYIRTIQQPDTTSAYLMLVAYSKDMDNSSLNNALDLTKTMKFK